LNLVRRLAFLKYKKQINRLIFFRGYYPKGGGEVNISVTPIDQLIGVDLTEFGQIKRFFGRAFVSGALSKRVSMTGSLSHLCLSYKCM
jgi:RNA 3'-terminal phosphate cyclase